MPARDIYHDVVVQAMIADGWTITDDPLYLAHGGRDLYVDLGAERDTIGAEKDFQKIAVKLRVFLAFRQYAIFRRLWGNMIYIALFF